MVTNHIFIGLNNHGSKPHFLKIPEINHNIPLQETRVTRVPNNRQCIREKMESPRNSTFEFFTYYYLLLPYRLHITFYDDMLPSSERHCL